MNPKLLILKLIAKNNGNWTWYQVERGLNAHGFGGQVNTIVELESLMAGGLIMAKADSRYPAPLYQITDKGKALLEVEN